MENGKMGNAKGSMDEDQEQFPWAPWSHCHGHKNVQSILYGASFTHTPTKANNKRGYENGFNA